MTQNPFPTKIENYPEQLEKKKGLYSLFVFPRLMCKTKMAVTASEPTSARRASTRPTSTRSPRNPTATDSSSSGATSLPSTSGGNSSFTPATSSVSSRTSLTSLRESISQNPHIYDVAEIRSATNNFLAKPYATSSSSSTKCWRCLLRGTDAIVFQRKFRRSLTGGEVKRRMAVIGRSHHVSLVKLLGAAVSREHIYLVYEFVPGANLSDCLRNRLNPNFTVLSTWTSRIQIAADVAHALDYIHHKTGLNLALVHKHIKSSAILVTDPNLNARICHFGAAYLCGDEGETTGELSFEGARGYMAPEFQRTGVPTQETDVYAFGVVILELVSGEEPLKYRFDRGRGDFVRTSVIETAREAVEEGGEGRLRRWVDRKLRDSFPIDVAEKLVRLALECVHVEPGQRPGMGRVAGKLSRLFLKSQAWSEKMRMPNDQISVSLAPR